MNKAQKQEHIDFLKSVFANVESMVLASLEGLDAAAVTDLRRRAHEAGVQIKVVKNKLAAIVARDVNAGDLAGDFVGSTAIAWSNTDAVVPAKILVKFAKEQDKFKIKSGFNAGRRLDATSVKALSELPSLEELRARLLGVMQAVPAKLLAQVNAPATHVVGVLQAKVDQEKAAA